MTGELPHLLVVDDDTRLRGLLKRFLTDNGFRVSAAVDAADASSQLESMAFDLLVLDVMMPGESGLDLALRLRRAGNAIPLLFLTAVGEAQDRIAGLEAGAEDYLVKPFDPRELVLRIRAILRRSVAIPEPPPAQLVRIGDLTFDLQRGTLTQAGLPVRLTSAETGLLRTLCRQPGETLTRETLGELSGIGGNARTIDVQVTRLRRKIEPDPKFPRYLQTVWGRGYVLRTD